MNNNSGNTIVIDCGVALDSRCQDAKTFSLIGESGLKLKSRAPEFEAQNYSGEKRAKGQEWLSQP